MVRAYLTSVTTKTAHKLISLCGYVLLSYQVIHAAKEAKLMQIRECMQVSNTANQTVIQSVNQSPRGKTSQSVYQSIAYPVFVCNMC